MDKVFIRKLRVNTVVGVYAGERKAHRPLLIDLDLGLDCRQSVPSDDIRYTVDYEKVCMRVASLVEETSYKLVETVAENIAAVILDEFTTRWVRVRVTKPLAIQAAAEVGVLIERGTP